MAAVATAPDAHAAQEPALASSIPYAIFAGDFNVGKSTLINALVRNDVLPVTRAESLALPTFVASSQRKARFAAFQPGQNTPHEQTHDRFLATHGGQDGEGEYAALAAGVAGNPFTQLVMLDTAGLSGQRTQGPNLQQAAKHDNALLVVVADVEYWFAKHNLDFIARQLEHFGNRLLVVANKADGLNARELRRIRERATRRFTEYGISAPPFYAVSARLEQSRSDAEDPFRRRMKPAVAELCDTAFDTLRVALYEFEARTVGGEDTDLSRVLRAPLPRALLTSEEGAQ